MSAPLVSDARYSANPTVAENWTLEQVTGPSRLFGANGLRTGPDGRIYVAQVTGSQISALDLDTGRLETVSAKGGDIIAPDDVAFDSSGNLYATEVMDGRVSVRAVDGTYFYRVGPDGGLQTVAMLFSPGYPGFLRGVIASGPNEFIVTTAADTVARFRPGGAEDEVSQLLAGGIDQPYGVAQAPDGSVVVVEQGAGRLLSIRDGAVSVLASGLDTPVGVVIGPGGAPLVSVAGAVVRVDGGQVAPLVDGLQTPHGLLVRDGVLFIVDSGSKELVGYDLNDAARSTIATGLPVGPPPGVTPKPLKGMPPFSGPQGPFAGITAGPDGTLYISGDGDGSVIALRRG